MAARSTFVSTRTRADSSMVSFTGISSGRRHDDQAGLGRVAEDVEHPAGLVADQADLHQLVDRLRRGELADDVAGGRGVDDDEVVVPLPHLPRRSCRR